MATQPVQNSYRQFQPIKPSANPLDNAVNPNLITQAANVPPDADQSTIAKALEFLGTPGGQAATGLVGSGLSAYGQYQQNQQNLQQNASQFAAKSTQDQFNADRTDVNAKATGVLNADPLGADQGYAQKNALAAAILPNLRNTQSHPADGAIRPQGASRGGIMSALPAGGFDPAMVKSMFGTDATAQAIAQRHQEINSLDPNAAIPDLSKMFGPEAAPYQAQMKDWATKLQTASASQRAAYDTQMKGYVDHMMQQEGDNSEGFWHKFAKIAGIAGMVTATILTAGAAAPLTGPAMAGMIGLGAASGAASSWGAGGSPLMGAITGGGGAAIPALGKK